MVTVRRVATGLRSVSGHGVIPSVVYWTEGAPASALNMATRKTDMLSFTEKLEKNGYIKRLEEKWKPLYWINTCIRFPCK